MRDRNRKGDAPADLSDATRVGRQSIGAGDEGFPSSTTGL
jgi:hypothetical protein